MNIVIICALFLLMAVLLGIAFYYLQQYLHPEPSLLQVRLAKIKQQHEHFSDAETRFLPFSRLMKDSTYANEKLGLFLERFSLTLHLKKLLQQAGNDMPVDRFMTRFLIFPAGVGLVLFLLLKNPIPLLIGIGIALIAYTGVRVKRSKRLAAFTAQLPDALNLMTSALRAGHSFPTSMVSIVTDLPDPISTEFKKVVNDINLGIPIKEALLKLVSELDSIPDLRMFSTAIIIQREAGGNLAEVLDKLSYTIRERFKLKGQISALTGQSRLTGYVLGCAPCAMLVILTLFFNGYVKPLYSNSLGQVALVVAAIMQIIGFFVMKKIIDIRV